MENLSGIHPSLDRVLILPDDLKKNYKGKIELPDQVEEHHAQAQSIGILVAVGPDCWIDHVEKDAEGRITKIVGYKGPAAVVGDRVVYAKYGGLQVPGKDGNLYRIMNDKDITALADEGVDFADLQSRKAFTAE